MLGSCRKHWPIRAPIIPKAIHFPKVHGDCGRLPTMMTSSSTHARQSASPLGRGTATPAASRADTALPWLVGIAFFLLYAATTAPSIVALFDDTLEFQLVLPTFGIAHPTGYPLYTLLGGVWSRLLPFGNWAWRSNLLSAGAAAATVALLFVLARRLTSATTGRNDNWAGLTAVVAFGFGPVWWLQATVAEVYALHNLLTVAILWTALTIPAVSGAARHRRVMMLLALIGLGLAHHRTVVLLLPGVLVYLLWVAPSLLRPQRAWLGWLAALAAPLLLYAYLPLRAAQGVADLNGSYVNTWAGFWDHVLARRYTSFFAANELSRSYTVAAWGRLWLEQTGWLGAGLSVLGLGMLADRRARSGWGLMLLALVSNLLFAVSYQVGDPEVFMLPAWLCAAVLAGGGLAVMRRRLPHTRVQVALSAFVLLLLLAGGGRGAAVNRSDAWAVHDYAVDMAKVAFPPGSRVIGIEGEITALKYMQQAERLGLAATGVVANDPAARRAALAAALDAHAPAYLTRELEGIASDYSFTGEGPLVRVWPRGEVVEQTPSIRSDLAVLDGRLRLEGYDRQRLDWAGGPVARLTLYWRPTASLERDLKVSLRIVDAAGAPLVRADSSAAVIDASPLRQVAATTTWAPGVQVRDVHEIALPGDAALSAGATARLLLIIYDAASLEELGRLETALP